MLAPCVLFSVNKGNCSDEIDMVSRFWEFKRSNSLNIDHINLQLIWLDIAVISMLSRFEHAYIIGNGHLNNMRNRPAT